MIRKRQILKMICAMLLIMLSAFFFIACNSTSLNYKDIYISSESEEVKSTGYKDELNSLLSEVVKLRLNNVPVAIQNEIDSISSESERLLLSYNISENQYVSLKEDISLNKTKYSISLYNIYKGIEDSNNNKSIKSFISCNIRTLGKDTFSLFVYDLIAYRLNYIYQDYKKSYEKSGIKEKEMNEAKYNLDTFLSKISKDNFKVLLTDGLIAWDLMTMSSEGGFSLSDSEIATLIQIPNFNVEIDNDGWTLILKLLGQSFLGEGYYAELFDKALSNNELDKFGSRMPYIVELINSVQTKLTEDVVSSLSGGIVDVLYALMPSFEEKEWELLENIFDISVNTNYWQIGYKYYKEDYTNYSDNVTLYTVNDLKTATRENVDVIFEGIIASIHPVFSYGWRK